MPQMAPYNWLNLYIMFTLILIYLISYIYFMNQIMTTSNNKILLKKKFLWKW